MTIKNMYIILGLERDTISTLRQSRPHRLVYKNVLSNASDQVYSNIIRFKITFNYETPNYVNEA